MADEEDIMHDEPSIGDMDPSEEFYEDESFGEGGDEEPVAEDWESYDSEFTEEANEEDEANLPPKKSSNVLIIGGAAILAVGVLGFVLLHHKPQQQAAAVNPNAGQLVSAAAATPPSGLISGQPTPAPDTEDHKPAGGMLNDPTALSSLTGNIQSAASAAQTQQQQIPDAPPVTPSQASNDALTPLPTAGVVTQSSQMPAERTPAQPVAAPVPTAPSQVAPMQPLAATSPMIKAGSQITTQVVAQPEMATAPAALPANPSNAAQDAKLDQLLNRVSVVENKLADVQTPSASDIQQIQQSIKQIDDRLTRLESAPPASAPPSAIAVAASQPVPTQSSQDITQAVSSAAVQQPANPVMTAHKHVYAHARPRTEKSVAHWVLKSAQPGQAYVSLPGQDDMVNVHVGDTLPGIGRIMAINEMNGHWVIDGTQGKVSE